MKNNRFYSFAILSSSIVLLSACSLAPHYERPSTQVEVEMPENIVMTEKAAYQIGWQEYFADEQLKQYIQIALENNRDLKIAALNIEAAQAQYGISRANMFPDIGASGSQTRTRIAQDTSATGSSYIVEQYEVGLGVTSFELDLFGKLNSQRQSALRSFFATQYAKDSTQISLIAAVAKAYFTKRTAEESVRVTQDILKTRQENYKLVKLMYDSGVVSAIDLRATESQIEQAKATLAEQDRLLWVSNNALVLLLGTALPEQFLRNSDLNHQFSSSRLPGGLPSEVLNYRPDVRQAEENLRAANAQIGAARAAFFPSISLTSSLGSASTDIGHLFSGAAYTWAFIPKINLPIFTFGKLKSNLDLAQVRTNISVAQYEKTVQEAFRDISDALRANQTLEQQLEAQGKVNQAEKERLRLVNMNYQQGVSSALDLLDAQRQSFTVQLALLNTRLMLLNNRVDVYKALGGGVKDYPSK